ncbi:MAG: cytochrome c-type biogenesis protein CcmH [Devosia nanyangense]|uniref:Cytochrome c-type biogenesis protein n=1 Tax=Devosia nanyangense TaxID=1228055 RepID=A0A933L2R1_9HYPH|nr:cytochrome c-type biogenesis protein CcmH [Devosia nanyangense]
MRPLLALLMLVWLALPAVAVNPDEMLSDPALEARARAISEGLRCLVCQNQSIDDSDADLAHELRVIVRERLTAGDTDAEVTQYLVDRYGEFVLLKPVLAPHTVILWVAAPAILIIGGIVLVIVARRRRGVVTEAALTADEQKALDEL